MKIAFGCDHAGFSYRQKIIDILKIEGHQIIDCGCFSEESCDYPDYALPVAKYVARKTCDRGILICGTGIGMCIAANKLKGVRAGTCYSDETAILMRKHNDTNIFCAGARFFSVETIIKWIKLWLETDFEGDRHKKRVEKIKNIEKNS